MKYTILLLLCCMLSISQNYNGLVKEFGKIKADGTFSKIDTTINQPRKLTLNPNDKSLIITWGVDEYLNINSFSVIYTIINKKLAKELDVASKFIHQYDMYMCTDDDGYPLMMMLNKNRADFISYYYWDNLTESFLKYEIVEIVSN